MMKIKGILVAVVMLTSTGALAGSSLIGISVSVVSSVRLQATHVEAPARTSAKATVASNGKYRMVFVGEERAAEESDQAVVTLLTDERSLLENARR